MKFIKRFVMLMVALTPLVQLSAQTFSQVLTKSFPCQKDFIKLADANFFVQYPLLANSDTKPEGGVVFFLHFDTSGKLIGTEYLTVGENYTILNEMGEAFSKQIMGFECEEALEYPSTLVIPIAFLPYPYYEYYQDPELKSEKTIFQFRSGLRQLLYDLDQSENFYVWDIMRYHVGYVRARD